jgi:hypothetical protein
MSCAAVIVTRGDVDLKPILESLPFESIVVWDNSKRKADRKVYGRYEAIFETSSEFIYTQDDDCILPEESIMQLCALSNTDHVVCNVTPAHRASYEPIRIGLVGWGAVFHRGAPSAAFRRYLSPEHAPGHLGTLCSGKWPMDDVFLRECDRIFTGLTSIQWAELPFQHMPYAGTRDRMFYDPTHQEDMATVRQRIMEIKIRQWTGITK